MAVVDLYRIRQDVAPFIFLPRMMLVVDLIFPPPNVRQAPAQVKMGQHPHSESQYLGNARGQGGEQRSPLPSVRRRQRKLNPVVHTKLVPSLAGSEGRNVQ